MKRVVDMKFECNEGSNDSELQRAFHADGLDEVGSQETATHSSATVAEHFSSSSQTSIDHVNGALEINLNLNGRSESDATTRYSI